MRFSCTLEKFIQRHCLCEFRSSIPDGQTLSSLLCQVGTTSQKSPHHSCLDQLRQHLGTCPKPICCENRTKACLSIPMYSHLSPLTNNRIFFSASHWSCLKALPKEVCPSTSVTLSGRWSQRNEYSLTSAKLILILLNKRFFFSCTLHIHENGTSFIRINPVDWSRLEWSYWGGNRNLPVFL